MPKCQIWFEFNCNTCLILSVFCSSAMCGCAFCQTDTQTCRFWFRLIKEETAKWSGCYVFGPNLLLFWLGSKHHWLYTGCNDGLCKARVKRKMSVQIPECWSEHTLSTFSGTPSSFSLVHRSNYPSQFYSLALSGCQWQVESCVQLALLASKRAKIVFSSFASDESALGVLKLLPLQ